MDSILSRMSDNIFSVLIIFSMAFIGTLLWVAIKQGRELSLWPPKLGSLPKPESDQYNNNYNSKDRDCSEDKNVQIYAHHIDDIIGVYQQRKRETKELRLMSIAASGALLDYATDELLLNKIVNENCHVKIMFLGPDSESVKIQSLKDGLGTLDGTSDQTISKINESVNNVKLVHASLNKLLLPKKPSTYSQSVGSLEVRLLDMEPNMTLFISDQKILWGVYTSGQIGRRSTVLEVITKNGKLYSDLEKHFEHLWHAHSDRWILRFSQELISGPELNSSIMSKLSK